MSSFPHFSNIKEGIRKKLTDRRKGGTYAVSKLNAWVRITSGTGPGGLVLVSNPNFQLFKGAGSNSTGIYGNSKLSGTIGTTWDGTAVTTNEGQGYRPAPIVSSMEIDEGAGNLSRKASFSITAHSKEQMEELSKYFLEPGYSMFIEWGWNTSDSMYGLQTLDASNIAKFQSFVNTDIARETGGYEYDNYLGFMTGGSIALDGDKWTLNVKCTGYTELPSYLLTTETGDTDTKEKNQKLIAAPSYGAVTITAQGVDYARKRWMRVFNELPDTRRTKRVKGLEEQLSKLENFIGFDEDVSDKLNSTTDGVNIFGFKIWKESKKVGGEEVEFPKNTKIISDKRFIKFSALMKIISEIGFEGFYLGGNESTLIKFSINSEDTYCSAFENIYSIDPDKLFIPNPKTPKFKLGSITADSKISELVSVDDEQTINNSVKTSINKKDNTVIQFPKQTPLNESIKLGDNITKTAGRYGKLDDLYVNFDFAKSVLETKNFFVKDALYQILNGISSAVNGMWDFQITENESSTKSDDGKTTIISTELKIHELNMVSDTAKVDEYEFSLIGSDSIFIDSSFDLDISGAKMNQIIGQKLGNALNGDAKEIPKGLFADFKTQKDLLGIEIKKRNPSGKTTETEKADLEQIKEDNLNILLGKLFFYPRVELTNYSSSGGDLYNLAYIGAFRDSTIFSSLKRGDINSNDDVSPLMPINFSFSIHGISGIKRGDRFTVNGIPEKYKDGFFQVLSVKHTLDGMMWKTEVTGGYRQR
jgi:hypothetical protein